MAAKPILITGTLPVGAGRPQPLPAFSWLAAISDYWALTKPEVNFLIAIATLTGFYLAFPGQLVQVSVAAARSHPSGYSPRRQRRRYVKSIHRTPFRCADAPDFPPPARGRPAETFGVLWFGIALSSVGSIYLAIAVNALASLLAIVTLVSYLFSTPPLKRKTPLCTLVGAFPGAMPPLIGWAAASGRLSLEAWVIYALLFLWQFPHFMAIAWMYRDDYARAGYCVLPQGKARDSIVSLQTVLPLLALFPTSLLRAAGGQPCILCGIGVLLLNLGFLYYGARFVLHRSSTAARRLLVASIIYLPSLFVLVSLLGGSSGNGG